MKTRPKTLAALAAFLALIAISFPLQIIFLFGDSPLQPLAIAAKLTPLNWVVLATAAISAKLIYNASPAARLTLPAFLVLVTWNNWLVAAAGLNFSLLIPAFATLAVFLAHLPLLQPELRELLTDPRLRWWLTAPRRKIALPALCRMATHKELRLQTFDISETGAFITTADSPEISETDIPVGTHCWIELTQNSRKKLRRALVIRKSPATGHYPAGFGVKWAKRWSPPFGLAPRHFA